MTDKAQRKELLARYRSRPEAGVYRIVNRQFASRVDRQQSRTLPSVRSKARLCALDEYAQRPGPSPPGRRTQLGRGRVPLRGSGGPGRRVRRDGRADCRRPVRPGGAVARETGSYADVLNPDGKLPNVTARSSARWRLCSRPTWTPSRIGSSNAGLPKPLLQASGWPTPWRWRRSPPTRARRRAWCCSKLLDADGFVFQTNTESPKARDLAANPRAALTFFWPILLRQVRVSGTVELLPRSVVEGFFAVTPRAAAGDAAGLPAKQVIPDRGALERGVCRGACLGRPAFRRLGRLSAARETIEFWQGREIDCRTA